MSLNNTISLFNFHRLQHNHLKGNFQHYQDHKYVQQIHTLFGPAMKKKLRSNFPWLSMTIKIYLCWCDLVEAEK